MVDLAVTIVNYKTKRDTLQCLASLFDDLKGTPLRVKIIVVDNSPEEELEKDLRLEYPEVEFIPHHENLGFGAGHNQAIESVDAPYYLVLNPDILLQKDGSTLDRMLEWMKTHPEVGMVGPKLLNPNGEIQTSCYRFPGFWTQPFRRLGLQNRSRRTQSLVHHFLMTDFDRKGTIPVDWIMGAAMLIRKRAWVEAGPFDDRFFMYYEDVDLCRRFWRAGWPVYFLHDIALIHGHRRASDQNEGLKGILKNPLTRVHLASWLKYFSKWGTKKVPSHSAP